MDRTDCCGAVQKAMTGSCFDCHAELCSFCAAVFEREDGYGDDGREIRTFALCEPCQAIRDVRQPLGRRYTYVSQASDSQANETMDEIAQDTIACIRDGWSGWAFVFARDAARKAFAENPHLRMIYCPECDRIMDGTAGTEFIVKTAEGEDFRTAYLCLSCAAWFI